MPLFLSFMFFLFFLFFQFEFFFFFNFYPYKFFLDDCFLDFIFTLLNFVSSYSFISYDSVVSTYGFQPLDYVAIEYNYNYRTYFNQTYLHAAYNKHMKPYKNILSTDRLFGDYNTRKARKHARATKHTRLFMLLYSHTAECFAFNNKLSSAHSVMFYFKRQHLYSVLEMFYASLYLGMIYFLSFTYTRMVEDSALNLRETEEIDEEDAQNHWYYYQEDRRGLVEPSIEDNIELDFAYPQHPVEWDDNGHFYRWEMHFFIFLFSFLICWGVSQSAASMFFFDGFIDLHFVGWFSTFIFIFIFWRIFFLIQFFTFLNRFNFRRFIQKLILPLFVSVHVFLIRFLSSYLWPIFYSGFSSTIVVKNLTTQIEREGSKMSGSLTYMALFSYINNLIVGFYRFIYSSFQKNLSSFEKRNIYDFIMSSNLILFYNSKYNVDNVFFSVQKKDRIFSNILNIVKSFIDNYGFNKGFFFPKNMYLTTNKITFSWNNFVPIIFPFYLDFFNVNDLPIWGADLFFNQNQNVFSVSETYENWFFNNQHNKHFSKPSFSNGKNIRLNLKNIVF